MSRRILNTITLMAVLAVTGSPAWAAVGDVWELDPIDRKGAEPWGAEPNWRWTDGNPMTDQTGDQSVVWTLAVQEGEDPSLTAAYTPMVTGKFVNFYYAWVLVSTGSANDPAHRYSATGNRERTLKTTPTDASAQESPSSASCSRFRRMGGISSTWRAR